MRPIRIFRCKKGTSDTGEEQIYWILKGIFTLAVAFLTYFIVKAFIVTSVDVGGLESALLANSPHFSRDGFSKYDAGIQRVYPGVVDPARFTTANAEFLFGKEKPLVVGRFVLNQTAVAYGLKKEHIGLECGNPRVACTDSERYRIWQPLAQAGGRGEGGKKPYVETRYAALAGSNGAIIDSTFIVSN